MHGPAFRVSGGRRGAASAAALALRKDRPFMATTDLDNAFDYGPTAAEHEFLGGDVRIGWSAYLTRFEEDLGGGATAWHHEVSTAAVAEYGGTSCWRMRGMTRKASTSLWPTQRVSGFGRWFRGPRSIASAWLRRLKRFSTLPPGPRNGRRRKGRCITISEGRRSPACRAVIGLSTALLSSKEARRSTPNHWPIRPNGSGRWPRRCWNTWRTCRRQSSELSGTTLSRVIHSTASCIGRRSFFTPPARGAGNRAYRRCGPRGLRGAGKKS